MRLHGGGHGVDQIEILDSYLSWSTESFECESFTTCRSAVRATATTSPDVAELRRETHN